MEEFAPVANPTIVIDQGLIEPSVSEMETLPNVEEAHLMLNQAPK